MEIKIRPQKVEDAQRFFEILNNDNFSFFDTRVDSLEDEIKYIESLKDNKYQINFTVLKDDKVVGGAGIKLDYHRSFIGEIGYVIEEKYWGQGIAPKVVELIEEYVIKNTKLKRLEIIIDVNHIASQKVALKAGYEKEGVLKNSLKCFGKYKDGILYAKILE